VRERRQCGLTEGEQFAKTPIIYVIFSITRRKTISHRTKNLFATELFKPQFYKNTQDYFPATFQETLTAASRVMQKHPSFACQLTVYEFPLFPVPSK
jgi:hypothetical protein